MSLQTFGQDGIRDAQCYFGLYDSVATSSFDGPKGVPDSENGWILPASGTLNVLVVFAEINYTAGSDPNPNGSIEWPVGDLPVWANDFFDATVLTNPQGMMSKYYHQASSGNLNVIGDYLVSPINNGIFRFSSTGSNGPTMVDELIDEINLQMGGNFLTNGGVTNPLAFDNWTMTAPGQPKITPSQDNPGKYDHVMFVVRNHESYNGSGYAYTIGFSKLLLGHRSDTYSFQGSYSRMPLDVCRHELGHLLVGGNNFHCAGGGNTTNYWIPFTGGHSMLSMSGEALRSWNAWDRYRLGWDVPGNAYLIAARDATGNVVNGDLDATNPGDAGIYVLRDFVSTGDAIRIKLPFIDPNTEYEQWLWLENHMGNQLNGSEFDKYYYQNSTTCVEPPQWGLTAAIQIDREQKTASSSSSLYGGYMDHVRQLSADGMWERNFAPLILDQCTSWNTHYPSEKIAPNPLTGWSDLDMYPTEMNGQADLQQEDQKIIFADKINGVYEYKLFRNGNPRQMFRLNENDKIGISTNPPSANRMNVVGHDLPIPFKNVKTIYTNGISVKILTVLAGGRIVVEVRFDDVDIENDVRWAAPEIELNPITTSTGYSLNLKTGHNLTLDHGTAATRMDNAISFEGQQVFTSPTAMRVKAGAKINLEPGSEMVVDRRSTLSLEGLSQLDVQDRAVLLVKREGTLQLQEGSVINVEDGGKIIIEESSGIYDRGKMEFLKGARINLNGANSILEIGGEVYIGDDAIFRLSTMSTANKTMGKIRLLESDDIEFTAGDNASLFIRGFQRSQEVIVNEKTIMGFPANLENFVLQDLRISQMNSRRIVPPRTNDCVILFKNVEVTNKIGSNGHHGIYTYGQDQMDFVDCEFNSGERGIVAYNLEWGNNLKVRKSSFNSCDIGISTYGEGAILQEVHFNTCTEPWVALNMSANSLLLKSTAQGTSQINVRYTGFSTLYVYKSNIKDGTVGLQLESATAKVACTNIADQSTYAINMIKGASLIMDKSYGGNVLKGNPRTINLNGGDVFALNDGENDLRALVNGTQNVVNGSLMCPGPPSLFANQNKWNNSGTAPTSQDYSITRSCIPPFSVTLHDQNPFPLMQIPPCKLDIFGSELGMTGISSQSVGSQGIYAFQSENQESTELQQAFELAINRLRQADIICELFGVSDESMDDGEVAVQSSEEFLALEIQGFGDLNPILSNPNAFEELGTWNYAMGLNELLYSFSELHSISTHLNPFSAAEMSEMGYAIAAILDQTTFIYIEQDKLGAAFYNSLKKAQLFRMLNEYGEAIQEVDVALGYASGDEEINLALVTTCYLNKEVAAAAGEIDTGFAWENTDCDGSFVSKGSGNDLLDEIDEKLWVFPNPTTGNITLARSNGESKIIQVELYDLHGRLLQSFANPNQTIDLKPVTPGVYFVRVIDENGQVQRANLLVR